MTKYTLPLITSICMVASFLLVTGCASLSNDGGISDIQKEAQGRLGKDIGLVKTDGEQLALTHRVNSFLRQPLTVDVAVQIALLNNKGLQASLYDVGISEADLIQASKLPNPRFSMLYAKNGDDFKIEQILTFNFLSLFTMPVAKDMGARQLAQTKNLVIQDVLQLAADTRIAYFNLLAAKQAVDYMYQAKLATESSAILAKKMTEVGNSSDRDQAQAEVFYAEMKAEYVRAKEVEVIARERLIRRMGLLGKQIEFSLPKRLPDLPSELVAQPNVEEVAMKQRLDIVAMQAQMAGLAKNLGLTKATRFINVLELGPARVLEGKRSEPYKQGVEISIEVPIFDFGTAKVARAEAVYMQALSRASEQATNARSEVREAYAKYRASYEIAKHYKYEILPLRKKIAAENILRYNGMLISVFELLTDAQAQIASVNGYAQALKDFWVAQSELEMAMAGKLNVDAFIPTISK